MGLRGQGLGPRTQGLGILFPKGPPWFSGLETLCIGFDAWVSGCLVSGCFRLASGSGGFGVYGLRCQALRVWVSQSEDLGSKASGLEVHPISP